MVIEQHQFRDIPEASFKHFGQIPFVFDGANPSSNCGFFAQRNRSSRRDQLVPMWMPTSCLYISYPNIFFLCYRWGSRTCHMFSQTSPTCCLRSAVFWYESMTIFNIVDIVDCLFLVYPFQLLVCQMVLILYVCYPDSDLLIWLHWICVGIHDFSLCWGQILEMNLTKGLFKYHLKGNNANQYTSFCDIYSKYDTWYG